MEDNSRRNFIKKAALFSGAALVAPSVLAAGAESLGIKPGSKKPGDEKEAIEPHNTVFTQEALPYDFDALEPYIDKQTMEIHYGKHHAAYVKNLNNALAEQNAGHVTLDEVIKNISKYNTTIRNNAGGHWNHAKFWGWMKPNGASTYGGKIEGAINAQFGSFDKFKEQFTDAAMKRFGSGWTWLIAKNGKFEIVSTPNQDNPLMDVAEVKGLPLLGLDVWEHAYYLKYQNLRKDYITNWFNVVNWDKVNAVL